MNDRPRLIERAFPLKQASLDSVHEKNVRHGHISTLHIWPARRPLAASRAALIATLLPDPGTPEERRKLCEKIGGKVVKKIEKKKMPNGRTVERIKEATEGGILHWLGSEPASGGRKKKEVYRRKAKFFEEELEWFRQQIRKAYRGRAPRVLDPFAGGGAIPLEAMRLGCEVTAVDINPVAWFILKCTLEYPQKLAGKTHPLPDFILDDEDFMAAFYKAHGLPAARGGLFDTETLWQKDAETLCQKDTETRRHEDTAKGKVTASPRHPFSVSATPPEADLAWHVRAWGKWVLNHARRDLAKFYPTYADFEPIQPGKAFEQQPMRLVPLKDDGTADIDALNAEFSEEYLADRRNPRWVAKPTVAYLWARTVTCKNCRAAVPLLKTRWLCKKVNERVVLTLEANMNKTGVVFGIENDHPVKGGNAAQKREHDKRIGAGTMSSAGAKCPCCPAIMTMEDVRVEGKADRLGSLMTAVVVDGQKGKEYRLPTQHELSVATPGDEQVKAAFEYVPFGVPDEPTPSAEALGMRVPLYGFDKWRKLFTPRQLLALGVFIRSVRSIQSAIPSNDHTDWSTAISCYLTCVISKIADKNSTLVEWQPHRLCIGHTFKRWALPMVWDFAEVNLLSESTGSVHDTLSWVANIVSNALSVGGAVPPTLHNDDSQGLQHVSPYDAIVTDPPYYDAIPYSDCMDFFYVWLRRAVGDLPGQFPLAFAGNSGPKWDREQNRGELIDDDSRHDSDTGASKAAYEDGMAQVFSRCFDALSEDGRLVIVFANKQPDAWGALVASIIRAGFIVDGSWPIQTEMGKRIRAQSSAALASSVWLLCKKRPATARPGWDNHVLEEMRANIATRLREFWDAGIRGPDFVWAATGPALEAYSKHPVVKKANHAGKTMEVSEFLSHVRRMVVDFVVGQVLTGDGEGADLAAADRMDAPTAYYLLHRHDFGLEEAPSGACILYATACGLSDSDLVSTWDVLVRTGGRSGSQDEDEENEEADPDAEADPDSGSDSGGKVKLKTWAQRKQKNMGYEAPGGQPVPLIDRIHRLMHLWRAGDVLKVDEYLDEHGLRRQELFKRLLQSLIELSPRGSDERALLESLSNHVQAKGAMLVKPTLPYEE